MPLERFPDATSDPSPQGHPGDWALPLRGVRILLVDDSRLACDALRLICQRSGARLRRAETAGAARQLISRHAPDLVIVDLGLPDEPGEALIAQCAQRGLPVIGLSGTAEGQDRALAAGAVLFIEKPIAGIAVFQRMVLRAIRAKGWTLPPDPSPPVPAPDPLALRDDLTRAAGLLSGPDQVFARGFLASVARMAGDRDLEAAACCAADGAHLARMVQTRLTGLAPEI